MGGGLSGGGAPKLGIQPPPPTELTCKVPSTPVLCRVVLMAQQPRRPRGVASYPPTPSSEARGPPSKSGVPEKFGYPEACGTRSPQPGICQRSGPGTLQRKPTSCTAPGTSWAWGRQGPGGERGEGWALRPGSALAAKDWTSDAQVLFPIRDPAVGQAHSQPGQLCPLLWGWQNIPL